MQFAKIAQDVLNIIKYTFGIELNESSLSYEKFMTHVLPYSIGVNVGVGFENKDINQINMIDVLLDSSTLAQRTESEWQKGMFADIDMY